MVAAPAVSAPLAAGGSTFKLGSHAIQRSRYLHRQPEPRPPIPQPGERAAEILPRLPYAVAVVTPREPYWEWMATKADNAVAFEHWRAAPADWQGVAYLIPAYADRDQALAHVEGDFDYIFADMLAAGLPEPADWPQERTVEMFRSWFSVALHHAAAELGGATDR